MASATLFGSAASGAQPGLGAKIDAVLADPFVKTARVGVRVVQVDNGQVLYSLHAAEPFIPASNMKLLTTAAAIDQLGADFRFVTTFAVRGDDLLVLACGDPGLGDPRLAAKRKESIEAPFVRVADALKKVGRTRLAGDLIVDASVFDSEYFHPNWPANQRNTWYAAEVAGLNFNDNCIDLGAAPGKVGRPAVIERSPDTQYVRIVNKTVTDAKGHLIAFDRQGLTNTIVATGKIKAQTGTIYPVPIHDPPAFAAQVLADVLARQGIRLAGQVRFQRLRGPDGAPPEGLTPLHRHEQPIGELLWRANAFSQNLFAEALLKSLSAYPGKEAVPSGLGSWAGGRAAVLEFLQRNRLPVPDGLVIDDGSGLSKANRLSPMLLTELLVKMAGHPAGQAWRDSLAAKGVEGTLRKRFRKLPVEDILRAKTGTLANASSLSGYVRNDDDRDLAFAILFDRVPPGQTWRAKALADRIVLLLAESGDKAEK